MEIKELNLGNISEYNDHIPGDIAENIGRIYYRGLIAEDSGLFCGGMVWEIKNVLGREDSGKKAHIIWLSSENEETGSAIFECFNEKIAEEGVEETTFTLPAKTSKSEKTMLKNLGFSVSLMEGDTITARLSEISSLSFVGKIKPTEEIMPLSAITQRGFNNALKRMVSKGHFGLCEDIESLPRGHFENDISCYCENDGIICGFFLCHLTSTGKLLVEMMAYNGPDSSKYIVQMICKAVEAAIEKYPPETEVVIDRHNYASLALGEKLLPRGFGIPVYIGERKER